MGLANAAPCLVEGYRAEFGKPRPELGFRAARSLRVNPAARASAADSLACTYVIGPQVAVVAGGAPDAVPLQGPEPFRLQQCRAEFDQPCPEGSLSGQRCRRAPHDFPTHSQQSGQTPLTPRRFGCLQFFGVRSGSGSRKRTGAGGGGDGLASERPGLDALASRVGLRAAAGGSGGPGSGERPRA